MESSQSLDLLESRYTSCVEKINMNLKKPNHSKIKQSTKKRQKLNTRRLRHPNNTPLLKMDLKQRPGPFNVTSQLKHIH